MKKKLWIGSLILSASIFTATIAQASVADYESITNAFKQDNKEYQTENVKDGSVKGTEMVRYEDVLYVSSKTAQICKAPQEGAKCLKTIPLGTEVHRVGICDNGWSKVGFKTKSGKKSTGYILNSSLNETSQINKVNEEVTVTADCTVLDFPGRKDGQQVGELLENDVVQRTGDCNGDWSRISYEEIDGSKVTGYIPNTYLDLEEEQDEEEVADAQEEGTIHKSKGDSLFADAVDGVTSTGGSGSTAAGVQIGTPVSVSSDATLKPLGTFRITHYCPCSICCGPWSDGITSTGVTATTNHTIAVNPSQIPYGSKVVINGQVYVAEDCGGAIVDNCIDIYVASHQEGEDLGVYYTDVYLLQE